MARPSIHPSSLPPPKSSRPGSRPAGSFPWHHQKRARARRNAFKERRSSLGRHRDDVPGNDAVIRSPTARSASRRPCLARRPPRPGSTRRRGPVRRRTSPTAPPSRRQGRDHRDGCDGCRAVAQRDVQGAPADGSGRVAYTSGKMRKFYIRIPSGSRAGRAEPIRPFARAHHLPVQVTAGPALMAIYVIVALVVVLFLFGAYRMMGAGATAERIRCRCSPPCLPRQPRRRRHSTARPPQVTTPRRRTRSDEGWTGARRRWSECRSHRRAEHLDEARTALERVRSTS